MINADGSYSAQYGSTAEWCPEASSAFGSSYRSLGWCPGITTDGTGLTPDVSKPLPGTMQQLVTLDLSDNALKGGCFHCCPCPPARFICAASASSRKALCTMPVATTARWPDASPRCTPS